MLVNLDCGLKIEANKEDFNDMRVLEYLSDDNPLEYAKVLNIVLGKEQKEKLYSYIAEHNNGRVPIEEFSKIFTELMTKLGEKDNDVKN